MRFHGDNLLSRARFGALFRDGGACQNFGDYLVWGDAFEICFGLQNQTMTQDWRRCRFHVVWDEEVAAFGGGDRFGYEEHSDGGARACP
jgi:hypothetical protein